MKSDVPTEENQFIVEASPKQQELQVLLPLANSAGGSFETVQAAVWIITDNADYEGLGTLVGGLIGGRIGSIGRTWQFTLAITRITTQPISTRNANFFM